MLAITKHGQQSRSNRLKAMEQSQNLSSALSKPFLLHITLKHPRKFKLIACKTPFPNPKNGTSREDADNNSNVSTSVGPTDLASPKRACFIYFAEEQRKACEKVDCSIACSVSGKNQLKNSPLPQSGLGSHIIPPRTIMTEHVLTASSL